MLQTVFLSWFSLYKNLFYFCEYVPKNQFVLFNISWAWMKSQNLTEMLFPVKSLKLSHRYFSSLFSKDLFHWSNIHWNFECGSFQTMNVQKSAKNYTYWALKFWMLCNVLSIRNFPLLHKCKFTFWDNFLPLIFLPVIIQVYQNYTFLKIFAFMKLGISLMSKSLQQLQTVWASKVTFPLLCIGSDRFGPQGCETVHSIRRQ